MKTIQIMPALDADQYCARESATLFGNENNPIQALSIGGGSPRLMKRRAMLILSRLPRKTHSGDGWLFAVRQAVDYLVRNDYVIVTSAGSVGWNYITWYAAKQRASLWIIFPPEGTDKLKQMSDNIVQDLQISEKSATFFMPILNDSVSKSARLDLRDQIVFSFAHVHYLICMRKNSSWQSRISQIEQVEENFKVDYPDKHSENWQTLLSHVKYSGIKHDDQNNYMIHWTRGTNGPWSGESEAEYFEALTEHNSGNPRDGYCTLIHIILSKLLRGSEKMIKGGEPVISFTDTNFSNIFKLIQYRNTLGRWNFEPYGIGFPRELLKSIGARSVSYGDKDDFIELAKEDKPYFQHNKVKNGSARESSDWSIEGEWRFMGDLDFTSIVQEAIFIVPTKSEADSLYLAVGDDLGLKRDNFHYLSEHQDR